MNTRQQRSDASNRAMQYALANRVFNQTLPYFGSKTQMPLIYFGRPSDFSTKNTSEAYTFPAGVREAHWPSGSVRVRNMYAVDEPHTAAHLAGLLLHELAHTQQPGRITSHLATEGGADAFSQLLLKKTLANLGIHAPIPRAAYGNLYKLFLRRFGKNQALYGQFRG